MSELDPYIEIRRSERDALKQENEKLKNDLELAVSALEFLRDRFYSDECEGPELRAQNATAYRVSSECLAKLTTKGGQP